MPITDTWPPALPPDPIEDVDPKALGDASHAAVMALSRESLPISAQVLAALMAAAELASRDPEGWSYAAFVGLAADALESTGHGAGHPEAAQAAQRQEP